LVARNYYGCNWKGVAENLENRNIKQLAR